MRLISREHRASSIAMVAMGVGYAVLYPKSLLLSQAGWVWDYPGRNVAFEHMFIAVYVTLGLFLIWGARDPVRFLPLIDFTIISGAFHATAMLVDALRTPGMGDHLGIAGDVPGTYLAPVVLLIFHPRRFYLGALLPRGRQPG